MKQAEIAMVKTLAESLFQLGQESIIDHGRTMPIQYIVKSKGIIAIPTPFGDTEEKIRMSQFTTLMAGLLNADAIIFLSEAWFAVQEMDSKFPKEGTSEEIHKKLEEAAAKRKVMPSEDPNRKEKLLMVVFFGNGDTLFATSDIIRTESEKRAYTSDMEWFSDNVKGQSTRLFKPWKVGGIEAYIETIKKNMPNQFRETLEELTKSLESGKSLEDQIKESMSHFGSFGVQEGHA